MEVSVIVPVYNKAAYIERCLKSIISQSFRDFEVIVVDDGSTDDSIKIARGLIDSRIKFLHQVNQGPGSARNLGLSAAYGKFVAFLDADDEWLPNYLEESLRLLRESEAAAVVSGYFLFPQNVSTKSMWQRRGIRDGVVKLTNQHRAIHAVHMLAYMSSWSTVVKKSVVERWGGFYSDDRCVYGEDSFLWLKILLNENIQFNTTPLVKFHREASDLSNLRNNPRPIEPFLQRPELIRRCCPSALNDLFNQILAIRAFKTVCMLGYWGQWKQAHTLFKRYAHIRLITLPYFFPALICSIPVSTFPSTVFRYLHRKFAPLFQTVRGGVT